MDVPSTKKVPASQQTWAPAEVQRPTPEAQVPVHPVQTPDTLYVPCGHMQDTSRAEVHATAAYEPPWHVEQALHAVLAVAEQLAVV